MRTGTTVSLSFGDYRRVPIAIVSVNCPGQQPNQLSTAFILELEGVLTEITSHQSLGLVVIRSTHPAGFGAADPKEIGSLTARNAAEFSHAAQEMAQTWRKVLGMIENLWIRTAAIVHGNCTDVALELALACHMILATPDAKMGFPGLASGLMTRAGGLGRLCKRIGAGGSIQMISQPTELLDADKALSLGLVDKVCRGQSFELLTEAARSLLYGRAGQYGGGSLSSRLWRRIRRWASEGTPPGRWAMAKNVADIRDCQVRSAGDILLRVTEGALPADVAELETRLFAQALEAACP